MVTSHKTTNSLKRIVVGCLLVLSKTLQGQAPGGINTNLEIWLKANAGSSTTTDGAAITQWDNQVTASTNHATQAGGSNYATYTTRKHNFNPAVYFPNGDNGFFNLDLDAIKNSDYNLIAVVERDNSNANNYFLGTRRNSSNRGLHFGFRNNTQATLAQYGNDIGTGISGYSSPQTVTLIHGELDQSSGKTITELRNNTTSSNSHGNTNALTGTGPGRLGRGFNNNGFEGYISEVIAYSSTLTTPEKNKIYSYLAIKYGFTLDNSAGGAAGDYTSSSGALLWDADVNGSYHNDVTGIGRDDDSELDQQKSISSNSNGMIIMDKGAAFGADEDFILWGNDAMGLSISTSNAHPSYTNILDQTWKAAVTGTPGLVSVSIIYPNNGVAGDYAILLDGTDANFSTGATAHTTGASISGDTITFTNIPITNNMYFTLGTDYTPPPTNSPGGISDALELWFKANAGSSTTTDGVAITQWDNQVAASTNHATQAGGSNFPTYTKTKHNYNPAVYFPNGDNGYFDVDLDDIKNSNYNLITIVERDNNNTYNYILGTASTTGNQGLHYGFRSNTQVTLAQYGNDIDATINGYNTPQTVTLVHGELDQSSGKTISELRNSATTSNSHANTAPLTGTASGRIGRGFDGRGFEGHISEVIAYSSTLTPTEKGKIYSYLGIKYGFTLDNALGGTNGDYTSSQGTVLWDADVNATYHYDVTGIGRDDLSELDQQKSISSNNGGMVIMDKGSAFGSDEDFILWGNDDMGLGISTTNAHPSYTNILDQTWKASVMGTPGLVTVSIIYPNNGVAGDYAILLDATDANFSAGATAHTTGASISGDTISFTNVPITNNMYFTLGTDYTPPPVASPGGVSNALELWFKANEGSSTTTDGAAITQWDNQISLSTNHATQAGTSNYPTWVETKHNYNPAVYFPNGDNGYFDVDLDDIKNSDYNLITIVERDNSNTYNYIMGTARNAGNQGLHYGFRNNTQVTLAQFGNDIDAGIGGYNSPQSVTLVHGELDQSSGKSISELRNSTTTSNSHGNTAPLTGTASGRIGRGFDNRGFEGYLSEVIAYSSTLSNPEKEKIYSYLAIKYGFTLDNSAGGTAGDYTSSQGTLLWDADLNSAYHNDITIIGRDDNSDLNQKQSKSTDDSLFVYVDALANYNSSNTGTITNDDSFIAIGHNAGNLKGQSSETPTGIISRFSREWKISNTNFTDSYSVKFEWDSTGTFNINDIRLLVDDDGDFSNATIYDDGGGLTISSGSIIFSGISTTQIPANSVRYLTIGSVSPSTPLPIELIHFDALANDNSVDLTWSTASEIDNDYFTIERSADGVQWEDLIITEGAKNSNQIIPYLEIDFEPLSGISYYRLKQTDIDGNQKHFNTIPVKFFKNQGNDFFSLFPNPATPNATVNVALNDCNEKEVLVILRDNTGKELFSKMIVGIDDGKLIGIPVNETIPPGLYHITATSDNKIYSQKLIVR